MSWLKRRIRLLVSYRKTKTFLIENVDVIWMHIHITNKPSQWLALWIRFFAFQKVLIVLEQLHYHPSAAHTNIIRWSKKKGFFHSEQIYNKFLFFFVIREWMSNLKLIMICCYILLSSKDNVLLDSWNAPINKLFIKFSI